jgi:type IV pilus assembly protein PilW
MKAAARHRNVLTFSCLQCGFSLVELLIAMVLGLAISAGILRLYAGIHQTARVQEARARMQENGRFALYYLTQELRMAGYLGCLGSTGADWIRSTLISHATPSSFQFSSGIQGWEATHGDGTAPGQISNSLHNAAVVNSSGGGWVSSGSNILDSTFIVPGTDIVRVWNASGGDAIIRTVSGSEITIAGSTTSDLTVGNILLLTDCNSADLVQACDVQLNGNEGFINAGLSAGCVPGNEVSEPLRIPAGGDVMKYQGTSLYIGKRGNVPTNPPALYRRQLSVAASPGIPEELIEGIENMQLLYGVNSNDENQDSVNAFLPANQVVNWEQVISVRVSLLVQSIEDGLAPSPQPYRFNGVTYDGRAGNGALPSDRRLRRAFTSTVALRNRPVGQ